MGREYLTRLSVDGVTSLILSLSCTEDNGVGLQQWPGGILPYEMSESLTGMFYVLQYVLHTV